MKGEKIMTNITIYDLEAKALAEKAEELDITIAELVEQLCEFLDECE